MGRRKETEKTVKPEKYEKQEESQRLKALCYLRAKFPEEEEEIFFTKYTGQTLGEIIHVWAVVQAMELEEICDKCEGCECHLPEAVKTRNSRPVISVSQSPRGFSYLDVRWASGLRCKYEALQGVRREMYEKSGLRGTKREMTFENYECKGGQTETRKVKVEAMRASESGMNLILAGKPGTGKTHLAVAIARRVMERGRQALFRLVSAMLDEIQSSIREGGDYDGLMRQFKTVPCLVLDDLGHENLTAARASYLHQIIDYRYVHKLQTIVTTNAKDVEELCVWDKEEYVMPMMSRILERGKWVTMRNTEDYRMKGSTENGKCTEE